MDIFWFSVGMVDRDDFKTDSEEFKYIQITGLFLVAIYTVIVLVLADMFIAILCDTYGKIAVRNYFIALLKIKSTQALCILVFWDC